MCGAGGQKSALRTRMPGCSHFYIPGAIQLPVRAWQVCFCTVPSLGGWEAWVPFKRRKCRSAFCGHTREFSTFFVLPKKKPASLIFFLFPSMSTTSATPVCKMRQKAHLCRHLFSFSRNKEQCNKTEIYLCRLP